MFKEIWLDIKRIFRRLNHWFDNSFLIGVIKRDLKNLWIELTTNETRFSYLLILIFNLYIKNKLPIEFIIKNYKKFNNEFNKKIKKFKKFNRLKTKKLKKFYKTNDYIQFIVIIIKKLYEFLYNRSLIRIPLLIIYSKIFRFYLYLWRSYRESKEDIYWAYRSAIVIKQQTKDEIKEWYGIFIYFLNYLWYDRRFIIAGIRTNIYNFCKTTIKVIKQCIIYSKDFNLFKSDAKKFFWNLWLDLVVLWKFKYKTKTYWFFYDIWNFVYKKIWRRIPGDNIVEKFLLIRVNLQLDRLTGVHGPIKHLHWRERYQIERYRKVNAVVNEILNRIFIVPLTWWYLWVPFISQLGKIIFWPFWNPYLLAVYPVEYVLPWMSIPIYIIYAIMIFPLFYQFYMYLYKNRNWEQNYRNRFKF